MEKSNLDLTFVFFFVSSLIHLLVHIHIFRLGSQNLIFKYKKDTHVTMLNMVTQ